MTLELSIELGKQIMYKGERFYVKGTVNLEEILLEKPDRKATVICQH